MRFAPVSAILLIAVLAIAPDLAFAQDEVPLVTRTYAIKNATVFTAPDRTLDSATVVVRDGLILAVGRNVTIPFDAEVVSGDSLHVYAGFVDGLSHVGIPAPREQAQPGQQRQQAQQRPRDRGNPTNERAGIQPERRAETLIKADDASIKAHREAGFAIAQVVPRGQMLPGTSALVALTDDPNGQLMASGASLFAQFEGARGVYPNTVVGVMAKWRQLYHEAERQKNWSASYDRDPTFVERPPKDHVHSALFPVIDGTKPVTYRANSVLEVHRALRLQEELGFELILAGVSQASEMVEDLAATNKPVLLTLKLPKEDKKAKVDSGKRGAPPGEGRRGARAEGAEDEVAATEEKPAESRETTYDPSFRTKSHEDVEKEKENLEARRREARQRYLETAAALEKASVPFGFTTIDVKAQDVRANLLKMVDAGLSEEAALAALTTNPAAVLGIGKTAGTIEPGKLGNLVITSGSYFDKDAPIRYVFVEGKPFEMEVKEPTTSDEEVVVAGTWNVTVETPDGNVEAVFTFSGEGNALSGTASEGGNTVELKNIELRGNTLTFELDWPDAGFLTAELDIDGDEVSGTVTMADGTELSVQGTRTSGPSDS